MQLAANITFPILFPTITIAVSVVAVSLATPLVSERIFERWSTASATESLLIIGVGTAFTLPAIIGNTAFACRVFWDKVTQLSYD